MGLEAVTSAQIVEYRNGPYLISTDPVRLDVGRIHRFLSTWPDWETHGIPRAVLEHAIRKSVCFGVYEGDQQIGFARVVTDHATFAFVLDDYIEESHRGRGLGKWLMQSIRAHPGLQGLRRWMLYTHDQRIYAKVGYKALREPEAYMEIFDPRSYEGAGTD